jgi:hypothetical protein
MALVGVGFIRISGDGLRVADGRWPYSFLYAQAVDERLRTHEIMPNMIDVRRLGLASKPKDEA